MFQVHSHYIKKEYLGSKCDMLCIYCNRIECISIWKLNVFICQYSWIFKPGDHVQSVLNSSCSSFPPNQALWVQTRPFALHMCPQSPSDFNIHSLLQTALLLGFWSRSETFVDALTGILSASVASFGTLKPLADYLLSGVHVSLLKKYQSVSVGFNTRKTKPKHLMHGRWKFSFQYSIKMFPYFSLSSSWIWFITYITRMSKNKTKT